MSSYLIGIEDVSHRGLRTPTNKLRVLAAVQRGKKREKEEEREVFL
jgi:hypothetical protein